MISIPFRDLVLDQCTEGRNYITHSISKANISYNLIKQKIRNATNNLVRLISSHLINTTMLYYLFFLLTLLQLILKISTYATPERCYTVSKLVKHSNMQPMKFKRGLKGTWHTSLINN